MGFKRLGCRVLGVLGLASESFGRCDISTLGFAGAYGRVCAKNVYEACKDLQVEGPAFGCGVSTSDIDNSESHASAIGP